MTDKPDVSKLREGDAVVARMTMNREGDFEMPAPAGDIWMIRRDYVLPHIVSVEPRPLKVGDRVTRSHSLHVFTIDAIADDAALLRSAYCAEEVCAAFLNNLRPA